MLERCTVGPNVTIEAGATVRGGSVQDAIVGRSTVLLDCQVRHCLIGEGARLTGRTLDNMVVTVDDVAPAP